MTQPSEERRQDAGVNSRVTEGIRIRNVPDTELFFALVGPIGTNTDAAENALRAALTDWNYALEIIRLSDLLKDNHIFGSYKDGLPEDERYTQAIAAGNEVRLRLNSNDAMAQLAIAAVIERRKQLHAQRSSTTTEDVAQLPRQAYLFRSLKLPEEIETLRRVYGDALFVISIHAHRDPRKRRLAERIKLSHAESDFDKQNELAEHLITTDEHESGIGYGQNVRDAFPLADFFTSNDRPDDLRTSIGRFVSMIFSEPFVTPTAGELAMTHAKTESMRSADLSRQIGATITTGEGEIISTGCNDVPRPGGGQYYTGDKDDARDYTLGRDPNDAFKRHVISEFLGRMAKDWLREPYCKMTPDNLVKEASTGEHAFIDGSRIDNLIEFGRILHADMAAILDAARRGIVLKDADLYSTAFPCHMCARLIIGAGIKRVFYIDPYPKSATPQLYQEQTVIDPENDVCGRVVFQPFAGVAPRRFFGLFSFRKGMRKDKDGNITILDRRNAQPRVEQLTAFYLDTESRVATELGYAMQNIIESSTNKSEEAPS